MHIIKIYNIFMAQGIIKCFWLFSVGMVYLRWLHDTSRPVRKQHFRTTGQNIIGYSNDHAGAPSNGPGWIGWLLTGRMRYCSGCRRGLVLIKLIYDTVVFTTLIYSLIKCCVNYGALQLKDERFSNSTDRIIRLQYYDYISRLDMDMFTCTCFCIKGKTTTQGLCDF